MKPLSEEETRFSVRHMGEREAREIDQWFREPWRPVPDRFGVFSASGEDTNDNWDPIVGWARGRAIHPKTPEIIRERLRSLEGSEQ